MPPTLQQATADPRLGRRLPDTHRQVWFSLLWDHCSFLLGPGVQKALFVPSKSLFPQSCVRSGSSMMGLMVTFSKRAYALCHTHIDCTQTPWTPSSPPLTRTSSGDTQTHFCLSFCRVSESWCSQGMFEPSEYLWQIWGLILNVILPLLPSC